MAEDWPIGFGLALDWLIGIGLAKNGGLAPDWAIGNGLARDGFKIGFLGLASDWLKIGSR